MKKEELLKSLDYYSDKIANNDRGDTLSQLNNAEDIAIKIIQEVKDYFAEVVAEVDLLSEVENEA